MAGLTVLTRLVGAFAVLGFRFLGTATIRFEFINLSIIKPRYSPRASIVASYYSEQSHLVNNLAVPFFLSI